MAQQIADIIARQQAAFAKIEADLQLILQAETTQTQEIRDLIAQLQSAQAAGAAIDQATIDALSTLAGRSEAIAASADAIVVATQQVPPEPAPASPALAPAGVVPSNSGNVSSTGPITVSGNAPEPPASA